MLVVSEDAGCDAGILLSLYRGGVEAVMCVDVSGLTSTNRCYVSYLARFTGESDWLVHY